MAPDLRPIDELLLKNRGKYIGIDMRYDLPTTFSECYTSKKRAVQ